MLAYVLSIIGLIWLLATGAAMGIVIFKGKLPLASKKDSYRFISRSLLGLTGWYIGLGVLLLSWEMLFVAIVTTTFSWAYARSCKNNE